ncbi:MAG: hypothetical protein KF878_11625 [Planctomycetes bacterium]|nr:hypothetical protein [Planctomycetota bacterium]
MLRPDPLSGELGVERAYAVTRDLERHMGQGARALHGYYLDDVAEARRRGIEAARRRYEAAVEEAARLGSLPAAEAAAAALVAAGGADLLAPDLARAGAEPVDRVRRRAAALALGEGGYLVAVPVLLELFESQTGEPLARAAALLRRLTGLDLDPDARERSAADVRRWLERRPLEGPFERRE